MSKFIFSAKRRFYLLIYKLTFWFEVNTLNVIYLLFLLLNDICLSKEIKINENQFAPIDKTKLQIFGNVLDLKETI